MSRDKQEIQRLNTMVNVLMETIMGMAHENLALRDEILASPQKTPVWTNPRYDRDRRSGQDRRRVDVLKRVHSALMCPFSEAGISFDGDRRSGKDRRTGEDRRNRK